ncbi:MAG: hypothetical protein HYW25_04185 [Candidatus Aenigmarchaeota archaeon]|nr:hypothetical protein [Candidatus Aenigmarchaeota archaeon]
MSPKILLAISVLAIIFVSGCISQVRPFEGGLFPPHEPPVCGDNVCEGDVFEENQCPRDCVSREHYAILEEGMFSVIVPKGYELLGEKHLEDLGYCYKLISGFLGIKPYYNRTFLIINVTERNDPKAGTGEAFFNTMIHYRIQEWIDMDLRAVEENIPGDFLYNLSPGHCANTHEFTHVFVGHLSLPQWANEGIASYAQKPLQQAFLDIECRENSLYQTDYWEDGKKKLFPYSDLDAGYDVDPNEDPATVALWYSTARCFWEYVDETYGREKMKEIFQKLNTISEEIRRTGLGSVNFIDDVLVPVLGKEIKVVLAERFGVES